MAPRPPKADIKNKRPLRELVDSILIVPEGAVTEDKYFSWLKTRYGLDNNVQIKINVEAGKGKPQPDKVVARAKKLAQKTSYSHVYILIDRDDNDAQKLKKAILDTQKAEFKFLLAYPCIEYWFLLHWKNPPRAAYAAPRGQNCKNDLYNKYTDYANDYKKFFDFIAKPSAKIGGVENAAKVAEQLADRIKKDKVADPSVMTDLVVRHFQALETLLKTGNPTNPEKRKEYDDTINKVKAEQEERIKNILQTREFL